MPVNQFLTPVCIAFALARHMAMACGVVVTRILQEVVVCIDKSKVELTTIDVVGHHTIHPGPVR